MAIVGLSFRVIGCSSDGGDDGVTNPQSSSGTLMDTVLSLVAGNNYNDRVTFNVTQTGELTLTITGPPGSAPNYSIASGSSSSDPYNRLNSHHHGDPEPEPDPDPSPTPEPDPEPPQNGGSGVKTGKYNPQAPGTYRIRIQDSNEVGGSFSVLVTQ